jgi:hypothetical protein
MATPHPALKFWIISLGFKDLFEESVSETELITLLKTFKRTELLLLLSKIGLVLHNDKDAHWYSPQVQMFLITAFLDALTKRALHKKLREFQGEDSAQKHFAVFAELQIVNLMKLAILHCSDEHGADISSEEERFRFGKCCLIMNDLLRPPLPDMDEENKEEVMLRMKEEIIRNHLFQDNEIFSDAFVRSHELFWELPPQLSEDPQFFDIPGAFQKATGFTPPEFLGIGFSLWSWWSEVTMTTVGTSQQIVINPKTFFQNVKMHRSKCDAIFKQLSLPADRYRFNLSEEHSSLTEEWHTRYSNVTLEQYPIIETGGVLVCLSMKFLSRKLTRNLFYTVNNSLLYGEADKFRAFFGRVFEEYVRRLLRRYLGKRCLIETYAAEKAEAGEAVLVYPRVLVIIEAKSTRLSLDIVRFGDLATYRGAIGRVLIHGCKQVDRVIRDFKSGTFRINNVRPSNIGRFYPVLVTIQSFPQDHLLCSEFDKLLAQNKILNGDDIAPPTLISIGELEKLEPLLLKESMVEVLGRKTGDERYRTMSVNNFLFSFYEGLGPSEGMRQRFNEIGESLMNLIFPKV